MADYVISNLKWAEPYSSCFLHIDTNNVIYWKGKQITYDILDPFYYVDSIKIYLSLKEDSDQDQYILYASCICRKPTVNIVSWPTKKYRIKQIHKDASINKFMAGYDYNYDTIPKIRYLSPRYRNKHLLEVFDEFWDYVNFEN